MMIRKLFRTAWNYKSQFISMIIMVAIGVGIFLGFNIQWNSLETDAFGFLEETDYADFRLYAENGFTKDDINAVKDIDGVDVATRYFYVNVGIKDTKKSVSLNVSENYTVSTMYITKGAEYEENSDGIWLSDKFAAANDIKIGDTLTFTYTGLEISGEVVGLCKSGENLICVADENQLMPDFEAHGFAYITPRKLEEALGFAFYPQINIISDLNKETLEEKIKEATGTTLLVTTKEEHTAYAGVKSEAEEGKTMGSVLPVLFLAIAILTMVTTMHRISANEKVQIGTFKALGFRDRKILFHYTSYGLMIGAVGLVLGIAFGYLVASLIISPTGMMSTYIDMPDWSLYMPGFCIPVMAATLVFLILISFLSVKKMLKGTAADALRPYTPKPMKKSVLEKLPFWNKLSFGTKWNVRDIMRHKARSAMTLVGVFGCMLLLVGALAEKLDGDWQATSGISYEGKTVTLDVYSAKHNKVGFLTEGNELTELGDEGVYLCLRLKDTAAIGDEIKFSPYGSEETYTVKVAGYLRSLVAENIVMTDTYADSVGIDYHIGSVYTDTKSEDIESSSIISGKQEKRMIMDSYDTFMEIMNVMIVILVIAAIVLGIIVLYNLGVMSYVERHRELATLKVLGFRDKAIGKLLVSQNVWLTVLGVLIGLPGGFGVLYVLVTSLVSEYELSITIGWMTYTVSILLTFGASLLVGLMVSRKNKKIDMVEALKGAE